MGNQRVTIVGGGLAGLTCGILLAEAGHKVTILEQHRKPGGFLSPFTRRGVAFDTGFHFIGSLGPDEPSWRFLNHLGVLDRLKLIRFPSDRFFRYHIPGSSPLELPNGFDAAFDAIDRRFPGNHVGLTRLKGMMLQTMASFSWYHLQRVDPDDQHLNLHVTVKEVVDGITEDPDLRRFLYTLSWGTSLRPDVCPFGLFCMINGSIIESAWRIEGGGGAFVSSLVERFLELGGKLECGSDVRRFELDGMYAKSVETKEGRRFDSDLFIATPHPKTILEIAGPQAFRPMFRDMIENFDDAPGSFLVFLELGAAPASLKETNNFLCGRIWDEGLYFISPSSLDPAFKGKHILEILCWMDFERVARWKGSSPGKRPPEYLEFKAETSEKMISSVRRVCPEIEGNILNMEAATPLTNLHYTRSHGGAAMGVSQGVHQQGILHMRPRNKIRNLFFAGQSVGSPGIMGTIITSYMLCDEILGRGVLWKQLKRTPGKAL